MRAYFTPYGVGLGHASRLVTIANEINLKRRDIDIVFSSFGEAVNYILLHNYHCNNVPPVEFAWGVDGGFSVKHSISQLPRWMYNFNRQINYEITNIKKFQPRVILSDTRLSPLISSKLIDIPSIVLLNQIKLLLSPRLREFKIARLFESMTGEFLGTMWNAADMILVPDLPSPFTISENNTWNIGATVKKIKYVGFTTIKKNTKEEELEKIYIKLALDKLKPIVFIHISGPMETRKPLLNFIKANITLFDKDIQFIISEGRPNGSTEPIKINNNCWYFEWCLIRDQLFEICTVLIIRAGHNTISQAIQFGKPIISIPIENHGEQLGNAAKIEKLGIGKVIHPKNLTIGILNQTIDEVLKTKNYREKMSSLKKLSEKLNGIENIMEIVRSFL